MLDAFRMLARYNRSANERIYEQCGKLELAEYRRERRGSFGSIHGLLNHILLGDRIWMARFEGQDRFEGEGTTTPALNTVLFEDFSALRMARIGLDARIEAFFEHLSDDFLSRALPYVNHQ